MTDEEFLQVAWEAGVSPCLPITFTFSPEDIELEKKIRSIAMGFNQKTGVYILPPPDPPINKSALEYRPYLDAWIICE